MKNKILKTSNINITKIILVIIIIASFAGIMYFVVKYFKETCPEGSTFNKSFNLCVKNCPPAQINDLDGTCICPNKDDHLVNNKCVPKCNDPTPDLCGTTCINSAFTTCIDDTPCANDMVCGDYCITTGFMCSKGKIMYPYYDTFILNEGQNSTTITIPANPQGYLLNGIFPEKLQELLNASSPNKLNYVVVNDASNSKKLNFSVTNNKSLTQSILNFKLTLNPEKLGFAKNEYPFSDNKLISSYSIEDYTLIETKCTNEGEENCGNGCCKTEDCINDECCTADYNKEKCGSGDNMKCCLKNLDGTSNCCNGVCCKSENNEKCVEGKCVRKCDYPSVDGKDVYCDTNNIENSCINTPNENKNGAYMSYCGNIKCRFMNEVPSPSDIQGLPVCQTSDTNPLFYSKNVKNKGLKRNATSNFYDPKNCTKNDCIKRLAEIGAGNFTADPEGNVCNTSFDCEVLLGNLKDTDTCPLSNNNQCCSINGKFTGQICKDGFFAVPEGNECICVKGYGCSEENTAPAGPSGALVNTGKVCKIIKDTDNFSGTIYPTLQACVDSGCKCKDGWRWNKQGEEKCNSYLCKDMLGRNRPDMFTAEGNNICQRTDPGTFMGGELQNKIDNSGSRYINYAVPVTCDLHCDNVYTDFPPGWGMCGWFNVFNCQGTPIDISGATRDGHKVIDKLTGDTILYKSDTRTLQDPGDGCSFNCFGQDGDTNKVPDKEQ